LLANDLQKFHLQIKTLTLIVRIAMQQHKLGYVPNFPSYKTTRTACLAQLGTAAGTPIAILWHITPM